jgi:signal transduction histidine kinase
MFQTLRPRDEVEGSGMGLAIVKKLVEQLGGEIWIEDGNGERGLKIWFTVAAEG